MILYGKYHAKDYQKKMKIKNDLYRVREVVGYQRKILVILLI